MRSEKSCGWNVLLGTLLMCRRLAREISLISEWLRALLGDKPTITITSTTAGGKREGFIAPLWFLLCEFKTGEKESCKPQCNVHGNRSQQFPKGLPDSDCWVDQLNSAHIHAPAQIKETESVLIKQDVFLPLPPRAGGRAAALMNVPAGRQRLRSRGCVITSGGALWSRKMTQPVDCYMPADIRWGLHSRLHRGKPMLKVCSLGHQFIILTHYL